MEAGSHILPPSSLAFGDLSGLPDNRFYLIWYRKQLRRDTRLPKSKKLRNHRVLRSCPSRPVLKGGLPGVFRRGAGSSRFHADDPERREVEIGWTSPWLDPASRDRTAGGRRSGSFGRQTLRKSPLALAVRSSPESSLAEVCPVRLPLPLKQS